MLLTILYIPAHLVAYVAFVRGRSWGKTESGIFLFHFCSFLTFGTATMALGAFFGFDIGLWLSLIALHGIYSLTFRKKWRFAFASKIK
jgi:hypothetical protein